MAIGQSGGRWIGCDDYEVAVAQPASTRTGGQHLLAVLNGRLAAPLRAVTSDHMHRPTPLFGHGPPVPLTQQCTACIPARWVSFQTMWPRSSSQ